MKSRRLFETVPGTDIAITLYAVWAILIGVGVIKGYGIGAYFMHLKGDRELHPHGASRCSSSF